MYNFIVANKEDSGHLVFKEKRQYMVRKHNFLELMFEHTTNKIYDFATKERVAKLVNSPTRSYIPGSCAEIEAREQKASIFRLMELAKVLDNNSGGNTHVETVKMMNSWHIFGHHLLMRNRSNYFNQIETGHFMSKGIVPKVPENLLLNELTNMWLEPSFI